MTELVFSVEDIFNDSNQNGCLSQYSSTRYHIPAYQRGYKWSSEPSGAVTILLNDLWSAFEAYQKQERKEYYLQYITVKKTDVDVKGRTESCLEVIDGQQRLTTLSVILSALSALLEEENISTDKLDYAIRDNFFSNHIYQKDDLENLVGKTWNEIAAEPDMNKQDIFYLYSAAKNAYNFFKRKEEELEEFSEYLLNYVKLIVNSVEKHVQSETVFKNLNSNKVPLTEADLIKGLLITKVGRANVKGDTTHFREVLEIRSNLGHHWAEKQDLNLNAKQAKALVSPATRQKQLDLLNTAETLLQAIGKEEYSDFNIFRDEVDAALRSKKIKLSATEKNAILNAVSWYDAAAEKVEKGTVKMVGEKLEKLLTYLGCTENQLADYGYFATGAKGEYRQYETESDLRDTENVPLKQTFTNTFGKK